MIGLKKKYVANPMRMIAVIFAVIILLGTLLLMLPISTRDRMGCDFLSALFTATSATCVTGLVMFDTYTKWSGFGQAVIITLIEIGGLGFISAFSLLTFLFKKRMSFKQKMVVAQSFSVSDMSETLKIQKLVLFGSLTVQGIGAAILTVIFCFDYDFLMSLKLGLFHSISAFCNAGFDILGFVTPGASLLEFNTNCPLLITLAILIIVGGLGFLVWQELIDYRKTKKFTVYTKLVLSATVLLLLFGTIGFAFIEWNNVNTIGNMSAGEKILNSFFQSVTVRTAGFDSLNQAGLTEAGKMFSVPLMLIGGSSGSTAGGIKTVTFIVILMFLNSKLHGTQHMRIYNREITMQHVLDALTLTCIVIGLMFFGAIFINITSPISFVDAIFETASALATVGLTAGATTLLSTPAKIMIVVFMYFGRIGILTLSMGFLLGDKTKEKVKYADANLLIG